MHEHRLKVLVVSRLYPRPSDTVLGIFVEEEVKELSKHCQIKVASPTPWFPPLKLFKRWYAYSRIPIHEIRDGIEVFRPRALVLPRNLLFPSLGFSFYLSLRRFAAELAMAFPFDLLHAHTVYPDGFAAVLLGKALKRPVVITIHGGDVTVYFKRLLGRRLGLWALSNSDRVIAVSDALRREVVEEYGANGEKITVIANGVDVTKFAPLPRAEASDSLKLGGDASRILYVGGIQRSKGIDYLLKAAARLAGTSPRAIEVLLVGDGDYMGAAKLLADELGIADSTTFAGQRPHAEIPFWMNACDVLVLPSLSEGFGVVLIEAMACGKPVVATRCGGPEDIVNTQTGLLVPPEDDIALSEALHEVLSGEHRFDAEEIRGYATQNYGYDRIASRILDIYRQLAQKH